MGQTACLFSKGVSSPTLRQIPFRMQSICVERCGVTRLGRTDWPPVGHGVGQSTLRLCLQMTNAVDLLEAAITVVVT